MLYIVVLIIKVKYIQIISNKLTTSDQRLALMTIGWQLLVSDSDDTEDDIHF